jgi:hypothetical protein
MEDGVERMLEGRCPGTRGRPEGARDVACFASTAPADVNVGRA